MPAAITAIVGATVLAAGGFGVGNVMANSGGTSSAPAAKPPPLAADPTGRPAHSGYQYSGAQAQGGLPADPEGGQAPGGGPPPNPGPAYVAHGQPLSPLGRVPAAAAAPVGNSWTLYLSGGDLLQPDRGTAVNTDQSVGQSIGGPCGNGQAGRWTAPVTTPVPFHGTIPGLLHVAASGPVTLTISMTKSDFGNSCTVLGTTTATANGNQAVSFTLPRVDTLIPEGMNLNLVISTPDSAHITSTFNAPSYVIAPTPPQ